ncbi:MAG: DUF1801 domain-containing protein [Chloroflexota bacterium]|nr:MAG: DUF1801 domain-containing protein [Chloroflexota bacterium]
MSATRKPASRTFSDEEKAAMRERAREQRAEARTKDDAAAGEAEALARIAEMPQSDRILAERIHALVQANAPSLSAKTWYGMPAYARDGKVVCFFQPAGKFKTRYATLGFNDAAHLDDGAMWPTSFALTELTPADERRIGTLLKKAAG